jgi:hypothetical protein
MAVIQTGITVAGNKKEFQALTTDLVSTFPTDCGAGSTLITIDPVAKKLGKGYYFDGVNWNEV